MESRGMERILVLPGDGIGPEVIEKAVQVLKRVADLQKIPLSLEEGWIGGASLDRYGVPITDETIEKARGSRAVLLGAVGGPSWEDLPFERRPEKGLLRIRQALGCFANLRPARLFKPLAEASPLRREIVADVDLLVVRELTGGIYFGEPRGIRVDSDGGEQGINTLVYTSREIERVARVAFEAARRRRRKVTSVDKANVLESTALWRRVVTKVHEEEFDDIELHHYYVDNCAMQLIQDPRQFDVILTTNLFGDILSDEAATLTGSIGMLPSASLGEGHAIYEPVHGSAPDIAGEGKANPLGAILSVAMLFRYSLDQPAAADRIERAVEQVLYKGYRTADLYGAGSAAIGTEEMGDLVLSQIEAEGV